jgi:hypothetical protein
MKCPRCSKEYDDSFAYCPHCTEPKLDLTQASLQPPQPEQQASQPIPPSEGEPAVPATSVADGKPSWLSRKKIVVIGVCVLLVIGLAVGLAVGLSGGGKKITESTTTIPRTPEQTAELFVKSFSNEDWDTISTLIDPEFLKQNPGFIEASKDRVNNQMGLSNYTFQYSGVKYLTNVDRDTATVTVTEGTVTYTDSSGTTRTASAKDDFAPMKMVKKVSSWYLEGSQFGYSPS